MRFLNVEQAVFCFVFSWRSPWDSVQSTRIDFTIQQRPAAALWLTMVILSLT